MEFCNGSSLATIIEKPENFHGLQQDEYLIFLKHLSENKRKAGIIQILQICLFIFKSRWYDWIEAVEYRASWHKAQ